MDSLSATTRLRTKKYTDSGFEVEFLRDEELSLKNHKEGPYLPAVIRAKEDHSLDYLKEYVKENKTNLRDAMTKYGAVIFRGFDVKTPQEFEDIALLIEPNLKNEYLGTSPRNAVTKYTFTASEIPQFFPVPQHIEMSFLPNGRPDILFFSCIKASETGGETPLCDFSKVAEDLDPQTKKKFEEKGVIYYRNYCGPNETKIDPWKLKNWPEIFGTKDKKVVESVCKKDEIKVEWRKNDSLQLTNRMPAFSKHPISGKQVWCNHSQVFHPSQASGEYQRISKKTKIWWHFVLAFLLGIVLVIRKLFQKEEEQGMNTFYGDGKVVPNADMEKVRDAIWKNMVVYPWKNGDIVMIDNLRISHGRLPFTGARSILVAWG